MKLRLNEIAKISRENHSLMIQVQNSTEVMENLSNKLEASIAYT